MRSAGVVGDTRLEPLALSEDERRTLENWVRRRNTARGLAMRARIVLACARGGSSIAVAARPGVSRGTSASGGRVFSFDWMIRFLDHGLRTMCPPAGNAAG